MQPLQVSYGHPFPGRGFIPTEPSELDFEYVDNPSGRLELPNDPFFLLMGQVDLISVTSPDFGEAFWWWAVCP